MVTHFLLATLIARPFHTWQSPSIVVIFFAIRCTTWATFELISTSLAFEASSCARSADGGAPTTHGMNSFHAAEARDWRSVASARTANKPG